MKRSKGVVVGGVLLAVLGMLLSFLYTQNAKRSTQAAVANSATEAKAWVAIQDLPLGSTWADITPGVAEQAVPATLRPVDAIAKPAEAAGKTLVRNVSKGEVITSTQFNATGAESLSIPAGTTALTLSMPSPQGVGDYIQPGSKADFFVTVKGDPSKPDGVYTKLFLSNIPVLANRKALSAKAQKDGGQPESGPELLLTFAVTTDQAERIIFAKENGSVWLTLMRPGAPEDKGVGKNFGTFLL